MQPKYYLGRFGVFYYELDQHEGMYRLVRYADDSKHGSVVASFQSWKDLISYVHGKFCCPPQHVTIIGEVECDLGTNNKLVI